SFGPSLERGGIRSGRIGGLLRLARSIRPGSRREDNHKSSRDGERVRPAAAGGPVKRAGRVRNSPRYNPHPLGLVNYVVWRVYDRVQGIEEPDRQEYIRQEDRARRSGNVQENQSPSIHLIEVARSPRYRLVHSKRPTQEQGQRGRHPELRRPDVIESGSRLTQVTSATRIE